MKDTGQVGVDQLLPNLVADLVQRPGADHTGVGHHDVEAAQVFDRLLDRGTNLRRVAHVDRHRQAAPTQLFNELGRLAQVLLGAEGVGQASHRSGRVGGDDVRAFGRQGQRMCAALAASAAGDQRDPSVQGTHNRPG